MIPDFPNLLKQFQGVDNVKFIELVSQSDLLDDEHLYKIQTNQGVFYVFEIDYISSFNYITSGLKEHLNNQTLKFYPVISPISFTEASPVKISLAYEQPDDWLEVQKYANDKFGSETYYFNFLFQVEGV